MAGGSALSKSELLDEYNTVLHDAYSAMRGVFRRLAAGGLTQDDIAERLDVDKALISKRLRGRENLTLKTLSFMASAMGCRLSISFTPYASVRPAAMTTGLLGTTIQNTTANSSARPFFAERVDEAA